MGFVLTSYVRSNLLMVYYKIERNSPIFFWHSLPQSSLPTPPLSQYLQLDTLYRYSCIAQPHHVLFVKYRLSVLKSTIHFRSLLQLPGNWQLALRCINLIGRRKRFCNDFFQKRSTIDFKGHEKYNQPLKVSIKWIRY